MKKTLTPAERRALPAEPRPDVPLIERGAPPYGEVTITKAGLEYVTWLAAHGAAHDLIADRLDIDDSTFDKLMGLAKSGVPTPLRRAFNRGKQNIKFEIRRWQIEAMRGGDKIMPMFLGKALLGDRDSGPGVVVDNRVQSISMLPPAQFEAAVKMGLLDSEGKIDGVVALPGSYSRDEYNAKLAAGEIFSDSPSPADAEPKPLPTLGPNVVESEPLPPIVTPPRRASHSPPPEERNQ